MTAAYCFPDTDVLLHFQTFDEVDWCKVVGASRVQLVLAPAVMVELNKHKDDGSNEWRHGRARMLVAKLRGLLRTISPGSPVPIRPNVTLVDHPIEPNIEWEVKGLDPAVQDDRLIATLIESASSQPDVCHVLVTNDFLTQRKAARFGIRVVVADECLERVSQESPMAARIEELERQVHELEHRLPKLRLSLLNGHEPVQSLRVQCAPRRDGSPSNEQIQSSVDEKRKYLNEVIALGGHRTTSTDLEKYSKRCQRYIRELDHTLRARRTRSFGSRCQIELVLENLGNEPAIEVELDLSFPDESFVIGSHHVGSEIWDTDEEPTLPVPPWSLSEIDRLLSSVGLMQPRNSPPPAPRGPLYDLGVDRSSTSYEHPKLRHKEAWRLGGLVVYLPPGYAGRGFPIEYELSADNLPLPVRGRLNIGIEPPLC